MKKFLILIVFCIYPFLHAQTSGDYRSTGTATFTSINNWQIFNGITWVNATVAPTNATASNTITILSGHSVSNSVSGTTLAANLIINGTLNVNANLSSASITINGTNGRINLKNAIRFDVYGNVTVNANATFDANFNPGDSTLLIVYGNYTNQGTTDFWKAEVIIVGNLTSPTTSTLQNNGNVIVGGNLIGQFDITGNGSSQIYALDPNATVQVTNTGGGSITPGSNLNGESTSLISIVNQVFGACYANVSTTWNGTAWSNGQPDISKSVIINGNYSGSFSACSLTVNSGFKLSIQSGQYINIRNTITNNGQIEINNNGSLVQVNNPTNAFTGNAITYKRKTTPLKQFDFTYWSAPLSNQPLSTLATNGAFYSFDPVANNWVFLNSTTIMTPGIGYIGRAPSGLNYATPQVVETTFSGIPNNGNYPVNITKSTATVNLIGNPYPCAISADLFLNDDSNRSSINGTIYLWTHNTAITNNQYTANDYAKYNFTGGVGTGSAALTGGNTPNGKIAAGQGFFVEANTALGNGTYTVTFKNAHRITGDNSQFFRMSTSQNTTTNVLEKHRFWLSLSNSDGAYNEMLVGYIQEATNGFDSLFDGRVMPAGNSLSVYSLLNTDAYSIQGKALPFTNDDVIPIGYNAVSAGNVTFTLENFDGIFDTQTVYLFDKETNQYHDLKQANFTFTTTAGTFNDRFEIRYQNPNLATTTFETDSLVTIISNPAHVSIQASKGIAAIICYDSTGKQLANFKGDQSTSFETPKFWNATQLSLISITLTDGSIITKKVILQ
ncbi:MAG: hypothetical protein RL607_867 [Bacteroidota bacterium]|jgi:hypothetical protein